MKHHISVTVRVDGAIEHIFDQVLEGRRRTLNLVCEAAQAMHYINQESEWGLDVALEQSIRGQAQLALFLDGGIHERRLTHLRPSRLSFAATRLFSPSTRRTHL